KRVRSNLKARGTGLRYDTETMRLAVTGGTGFVGSHLLDSALAAGHSVAALARRDQEPRDSLDWISGSLEDRDALRRLVDGADAIIHVAGTISAPNAAAF